MPTKKNEVVAQKPQGLGAFLARRPSPDTKRKLRRYAVTAQIKGVMMAKGLSQKSLAEQMGKKESQVCRQLNGANITLDSLFELADAVGEEVEIYIGPTYRSTVWAMVQVVENPLVSKFGSAVVLTLEDGSSEFKSVCNWLAPPIEGEVVEARRCEDVSFVELQQITF